MSTSPLTVCKIVHDHETDEWIVRAYILGNVRCPAADYFTDDKADAWGTAMAMLDAAKPAGARIEIDTKKRLAWWTPIPNGQEVA
jgi:hypothetical protein